MKKINRKTLLCSAMITLSLSAMANADQVIYDDFIVVGSACIGIDCQVDQDFDFDSLKLQAPNPQINFVDTSSSAQFPTNDWKMGVTHDETDVSHFYITDVSAGVDVLKLSASESGGIALGANSQLVENAISVGSTGNERKVINLADGVAPTDGVNLGQLKQLEASFQPTVSDIEAQLNDVLLRIEALNQRLDDLQ